MYFFPASDDIRSTQYLKNHLQNVFSFFLSFLGKLQCQATFMHNTEKNCRSFQTLLFVHRLQDQGLQLLRQCGERSCWNRALWCNSSRNFQSGLSDSWLSFTSLPVQLSLTSPDRKLDRRKHVRWCRVEQMWTRASFRQRVFMRQRPAHQVPEPSQSGSGNVTGGEAAAFAALSGHRCWTVETLELLISVVTQANDRTFICS